MPATIGIVISTLAGIETNVQLRPLLTKGLHLVGSMLRNRTPSFKAYILSELVSSTENELCESFISYIHMAAMRFGIEIVDKNASIGENILNVYASRLCEESIELLAKHLAAQTVKKRSTENGLRILINFV